MARAGLRATLYEMRPSRSTAAHKTGRLAELVCSNSLKSEAEFSAPWLLKQELRRLGSLLLGVADECRVPAGQALTVDREEFSRRVSEAIEHEPLIQVRREEVCNIPPEGIVIVATGPLTSDALAADIARLAGSQHLYFFDSISPIVDAETIDYAIAFRASRYGKSLDGSGDYLNCPLDKAQYDRFLEALLQAESAEAHIPEDAHYFEACLPIEELARRGRDTLRFGPMKPVGLVDPRTRRRPYAVVQLRAENARQSSYNLVGFQNHLKFGEQQRVLRMIPGLERAEFLRLGQVHRNTYINSPELLAPTLQLKSDERIFFAGQICGVEGYVESIATGLAAGRGAARAALSKKPIAAPRETAVGSLCHYITAADAHSFQPANITFDLLPAPAAGLETAGRRLRRAAVCRQALVKIEEYANQDE